MPPRTGLLAGLVVVALALTAQSCREVVDPTAPAIAPPIAEEDQDVIHLGGTWYAKSLPGTHRYDVYEVRFCLKGEQKARTFEELLSLERRGLLGEGDEVIPRWVRTKEAVSEEEILRCETRVLLRESRPPSEPPYVCPCCRTNDCDTWGCIKTCFR